MLEAGAAGYLLKDDAFDELKTRCCVSRNQTYLSPAWLDAAGKLR